MFNNQQVGAKTKIHKVYKIAQTRLKPFLTFPYSMGMVTAKRKYPKIVDKFAALGIHDGDEYDEN